MSFGGSFKAQIEEDALAIAFGHAVLVAAAGNDSSYNDSMCGNKNNAMYPGSYPWILGVMASSPTPDKNGDWLAGFSNWDCTPQNSIEYELMAPGSGIYSTLPENGYAAWSGTSMATPVVAGIAALTRSYFSNKDVYSSRFIMGQIASTGDFIRGITPPGCRPKYFHLANAYKTLSELPEPSVAYMDHWIIDSDEIGQSVIGDKDGKADAGETIELAMMIRNHWSKADNVNVTLKAHEPNLVNNDPYVTWEIDTVNYGAIGTFDKDDNGITYNEGSFITAVQNPFRFTISPDTPNGHWIPIEVSISVQNGYIEGSPQVDQKKTVFYIQVQRGHELPSIIGGDAPGTDGEAIDTDGVQDGVVTLDDSCLWIIDKPVLIEKGVIVNVTPGAEIQWWATQSEGFYNIFKTAFLQVEGTFNAIGTAEKPIVLRPSDWHIDYMVVINKADEMGGVEDLENPDGIGNLGDPVTANGLVNLKYADIHNAFITASTVDHCIFRRIAGEKTIQNLGLITKIDSTGESINATATIKIDTPLVTNSRFFKVGAVYTSSRLSDEKGFLSFPIPKVSNCLFDSSNIVVRDDKYAISGNVFLKNYKLGTNTQTGDLKHFTSEIKDPHMGIDPDTPKTAFLNNAILNTWHDPNPMHWMTVKLTNAADHDLSGNYWGGAGENIIDIAITDYQDNFSLGLEKYKPYLTEAPEQAYPFVVNIDLLDKDSNTRPDNKFGAEAITRNVTFNRDMNTDIQPDVSFGPDIPFTDFMVQPTGNGWVDNRTWSGTSNITPVTGDGWQLVNQGGRCCGCRRSLACDRG